MELGLVIVIVVICVLLEGFFSGSEMAVVNADKYRLALATDGGSKRALSALHLVKHPAKFFTVTLLGTNISTVTASVVVSLFIIDKYGEAYAPFALVLFPFSLIFGEIVPKSIYQHYADWFVMRVSPILLSISFVAYPIIWFISIITDTLLGGLKKQAHDSDRVSRETLELLIEVGSEGTSDVRSSERTMISRIFDLADKQVKDIMTPLVDVVALPMEANRADAERAMEEYGFSRIPVYERQSFNIVGILLGTDLFFREAEKTVKDLYRPAYYVPEEMPLDELLIQVKRTGQVLAVAVDEYGAASGIVTAEDLIEEVVGEIHDEHDEAQPLVMRVGKNHYIINGRYEVEKVNEKLKLGIPEGHYATLAGFIIHHLERIPMIGDKFQIGKLELQIRKATDRAILEVEIKKRAE